MSSPGDDPSHLADTLPAGPEDRPLGGLPAKIGRFVVASRLGQGGMGVVLLATDPLLERRVAIKVLRGASNDAAQRRLLREAQAMAKLSHENVIVVHEVGTHDGQVYVAMELVTGTTLRHWQAGRPWREIVERYVRAGRGLAAAHAAGLVHRDFKPDNVLVGDDGRVRVTDFGLVSADGEAGKREAPVELGPLTQTGTVMGTPRYMAPEQHLGEVVDARADQFAFCVSLFEALHGGPPFTGTTYEELSEHVLAGDVASVPVDAKVPAAVREVVMRGLSRERAARHPSMQVLLDALVTAAAGPRRRWPTIAAAIASLAIGIGIYAGISAAMRSDDPAGPAHGTRVTYAIEPAEPGGTLDAAARERTAEIVRTRIARRGVTSFRVAVRGAELVVDLPAMGREAIGQTEEMIKRSARLELHVVDEGAAFMREVTARGATDPDAAAAGIVRDEDNWAAGGDTHTDVFLRARDTATTTGRAAIERYLARLAATDARFVVPADRRIAYEYITVPADPAQAYWRTYEVVRATALTSSVVTSAKVTHATGRLQITVRLSALGAQAFEQVTTANVGKKLAFLLEDQVENAHVVNAPIHGPDLAMTFGRTGERDAEDLAIALEAGALPGTLHEVSSRDF